MTKTVKTILLYWIPAIIWMGVIFYLSSLPDLKTNLGIWDTVLRKCAHGFEFAILLLLVWRAFRQSSLSFKGTIGFAFVFSFLYAISDELHQMFVAKRVGSPLDVGIDTLGILLMILVIWMFHRRTEVGKIQQKLE